MAFLSTAKEDTLSRIVPMLYEGSGVVTTRNDVHYVATEHGVAHLHGKTVRERARSLISIAHPKFHEELTFAHVRWAICRSCIKEKSGVSGEVRLTYVINITVIHDN